MTQHVTEHVSKQHNTTNKEKYYQYVRNMQPSHAAHRLVQWTGDHEPNQEIQCSETSVGRDGPLLDCARCLGRIWSPNGHVVGSMRPWEQKRMQGGNNTRGNNTRGKNIFRNIQKIKKHGNKLQVSHFPLLVIGLNLTLPSLLKINHSDLLVVPIWNHRKTMHLCNEHCCVGWCSCIFQSSGFRTNWPGFKGLKAQRSWRSSNKAGFEGLQCRWFLGQKTQHKQTMQSHDSNHSWCWKAMTTHSLCLL